MPTVFFRRPSLFFLFTVALFGAAATSWAAQDPLDLGAADSIIAVVSQPRLGVDHTASVAIYLYNDAQAVEAVSIGFSWNTDKFTLDSVVASPQSIAAFTIFRYGLYKGSVDSSNAARRFLWSGGGFPSTALAAGSQPKLLATWYFSIAEWAGGESFCIDSHAFVAAMLVDTDASEYAVNWRGETCVYAATDSDSDGLGDTWDNCPYAANPAQEDADGDGSGDACDLCTDTDNDGFGNPGYPATTCVIDNCPVSYNPGQEDENHNGYGDLCDGQCCSGRVGDANGVGGDEPSIADVSCIIDLLFISQSPTSIACPAEADVNRSGGAAPGREDVTISDVSVLIDYLFITGPSLGLQACP